jgi:nucleoside-diphosphate-sugar epimerase
MLHLVTGGSGFVGSTIVRLLRERGENVRVLDIWKDPNLSPDVEFIHCDIIDAVGVQKAMEGVDYVHHNVALVPLAKAGSRYWTVNVEGTQVALAAAQQAGVHFFSHMSSSTVFGLPDIMPITNDTPRKPIEIYGETKKAGEDLVFAAMHDGMQASVIRPRCILGAGRLGIFQILFDWIKDGANICIIGKGDNLFQFVHAEDLATASIQACLLQRTGTYNVGTTEFSTLRSDLEYLCTHAGTGSRVRSLPVWGSMKALTLLDKCGLSPLSPWHYLTYHKPFYFDSTPAFSALEFQPRYSNREMLTMTYDWFIKNRADKTFNAEASAHKRPVKQGILKILKSLS